MTYQAASGAGARNMRELQQMGGRIASPEPARRSALGDLDIDREVAGILRDDRFPTEHRRAARRLLYRGSTRTWAMG
jgi:aspartate-semialdehyde dehydrogenase